MDRECPATISAARPFGPRQAVVLSVGMIVASLAGSTLVMLGWGIETGVRAAMAAGANHHGAAHLPTPGMGLLAVAVLAGYGLSSAWALGYCLYSARALLGRGEARGFGWCRAQPAGYAVAVILAAMAVTAALSLADLIPPDTARLFGPGEELARSHGWPHVAFVVLVVAVAPVVEEFVFRGALIAAFVKRCHVAVAVLISTVLFVALHVADKIYYWPGFIDVGLLGLAAAYVRLRYRSLRPAIVLHFLYNAALIALPLILRTGR